MVEARGEGRRSKRRVGGEASEGEKEGRDELWWGGSRRSGDVLDESHNRIITNKVGEER